MITFIDKLEHRYNSGTAVTSRTISAATGTRSHGMLGVVVNVINGGDVSSITWNGTPLEKKVETGNPAYSSDIWWLPDFGGGTHDVVINFASGSMIFQAVIFWADSDNTLEAGAIDTAAYGTDENVWVELETTVPGTLCVSGGVSADNNLPTAASDTSLASWDQGGNIAVAQYKLAALTGNQVIGYARDATGRSSPFNLSGAVFYEPSTNSAPTIALDTPDETSLPPNATLEFTAADADSDDVRYQVQIADNPGFKSGVYLQDDFSGGGGLAIHPNPMASGLTWLGQIPPDDRPGGSCEVDGGKLHAIRLYFAAHETSPEDVDGTAYLRLYAHDGVYGTSSAPANAADPEDTPTPGWLAISDAYPFNPGVYAPAWHEFTFSGSNQVQLQAGYYVFILDWVPADRTYTNAPVIYGDSLNEGALHPGNLYIDAAIEQNNGPFPDWDIWFEFYATGAVLEKTSGTDAGFENTVTPADTDPFTEGQKARFTVQSGDELVEGATYYWRVRASDPDGSGFWSDWSEVRSFTVSNVYGGALNATLGAITVEVTAEAAVSGALDATLGSLGLEAEAGAAVTGALDATLDALALTAELETLEGRSASLDVTLGALTAEVTASTPAAGALSATLSALTAEALSEAEAAGALDAALDTLTVEAAAEIAVTGALPASLSALTAEATGSASVGGALSATLEDLQVEAAGAAAVTAGLSQTLDTLTAEATGQAEAGGALDATLGGLQASAAGGVGVGAALYTDLGALTTSAAGSIPVTASLDTALGSLSASIVGAVGDIPVYASLSATVDALTAETGGEVTVSGALDIALDGLNAESAGTVTTGGTLDATLGGLAFEASGAVSVAGSLGGGPDPLTASITGQIGARPVDGALDVTLGGLTAELFGAVAVTGSFACALDGLEVGMTAGIPVSGALEAALDGLTLDGRAGAEFYTILRGRALSREFSVDAGKRSFAVDVKERA